MPSSVLHKGEVRKVHLAELSPLFVFIDSVYPLSEGAKEFISQHVYSCSYSKKEIILNEGSICNDIYFIKNGVVRGFIRDGSREITTSFTKENEMVTSVSSMESRRPSSQSFQAIENVELFVMGLDHLQVLFRDFPESNSIARKFLQHYFAESETIALISRLKNADSKYTFFLRQYKELADRLPLRYVASFLSVTNETLSRIRRKKKYQ